MNSNPGDRETLRKRLLWRATHRGIKEMDIMVGGFATARLGTMSEVELHQFAAILELPDQDLLSWATRQSEVPDAVRSPMLLAILSYRPDTSA